MIPALLCLLSSSIILAIRCPPPHINDNTKTGFRYMPDEEDFYESGSKLVFQCQEGTESVEGLSNYTRICQEDGTWTNLPPLCGSNVAKGLPIQTWNGTCLPLKRSCNLSPIWEVKLKEKADIDAIGIEFEVAPLQSVISVEVSNLSGVVGFFKIPVLPIENSVAFTYFHVEKIEHLKIKSDESLKLKNIILLSVNQGGNISNCPYPGSPEGGKIVDIVENSQVTYQCVDGYTLEGESVRKCDKTTRKYSTSLPKCVKN